MRAPVFPIVIAASALLVATEASAARLNIPDDNGVHYSAYFSKAIEQPWAPQRPEAELSEQHLADIVATKLGVARGSAELFRYRLENAPSNATVLRGQIDGGGIKLKLTW
jgi:hypothetical protein